MTMALIAGAPSVDSSALRLRVQPLDASPGKGAIPRVRAGSAAIMDLFEAFAEMACQSTGYRTVRTPRIWSLHDLTLPADEPR